MTMEFLQRCFAQTAMYLPKISVWGLVRLSHKLPIVIAAALAMSSITGVNQWSGAPLATVVSISTAGMTAIVHIRLAEKDV